MNKQRFDKEVERLIAASMTPLAATTTAAAKEHIAILTPRSYGVATNNSIVIMKREGITFDGTKWSKGERFRSAGCDIGPYKEPIMIDGKWRDVDVEEFELDPNGPPATIRVA